jgi:hypothetical protein
MTALVVASILIGIGCLAAIRYAPPSPTAAREQAIWLEAEGPALCEPCGQKVPRCSLCPQCPAQLPITQRRPQ